MKRILPQSFTKVRATSALSTQASWQKRHLAWLTAAVFLPLSLMVTAYGVVEYGPSEPVNVRQVTQQLITPTIVSAQSDTPFWREEIIQTGDGLGKLFNKLSINDNQAWEFIRTDPSAKVLYELSAGRLIRAQTTPDGRLLQMSYLNKAGNLIQVIRDGEQLRTQIAPAVTEKYTQQKSGTISSSFYGATDAIGLPDEVAQQLIEAFEQKVDFHNSLKAGDHFSVIYEVEKSGGEDLRTGRILAAQFTNNGQKHEIYWFAGAGIEGAYFDQNGETSGQSFLSSPVKFSRISSGFSRRFHPVLFKWKSHKGVDYAAPTGTPIYSAADGVVTRVTRDAGYGKFIEIKHGDQYSTLYAHLSAFAKGLKPGQSIKKGEVIGAVGRTGRVTGPHLHYEFKVKGTQVNPLTLKLPNSKPLNATQLAQFKPQMLRTKQQLALLSKVELAKLD
ncbi:peptidoglycan DD-metalloendopeptidase family protein [Deefgea piscis]|uniref:DD-carboxypeptidase/endopeptidase Mpg n=1 Tax=Deefgea piscis TaxID=2739061 RepID=A0A6M8SR41_9NEIS|nr:peptidoglycan DD-metalloendopeptidase family protein [Deefgea piscis]QKJ67665.1 peptidoglycan DD-metalloendopeptidase family protein [Deefgea piscis]